MKSFFDGTPKKKALQRAVVAGVRKKGDYAAVQDRYLDEIISLCRTAGAEVVGRFTQAVDRFNPATLIGSGKVEELAALVKERGANLVIFDTSLSPSQQMNLEKRLKLQVVDRPGIILDIFALHARTRESRVQVELAQFEYLLPRLARGWKHLERQEGSIGTRGPGETQLETDRRLIRLRISELKKKLKRIESERMIQRKMRKGLFKVCLVGYTNTGKSSIFNFLTGENITAANYLFATLDSTTRRLKLSGKNELLVSDTVGFIRKLPVSLVASFKSTLYEVSGADLLIHVIDISESDFDDRIATVNGVLREIKCDRIPVLHVFNKIDKLNDPDLFRSLLGQYPGSRFASAVTGEGMARLVETLEYYLDKSRATVMASIPPRDGDKLSLLSSLGQLIDSETDNGILKVKVKIPVNRLGKLESKGIDFIRLKD
ncbi:MAG: GTPase HflX [Candidatus Zixiibacteriota bacterium]|nr:MAG: GTPase HflX [candidate division Zixibacteria bacterium]